MQDLYAKNPTIHPSVYLSPAGPLAMLAAHTFFYLLREIEYCRFPDTSVIINIRSFGKVK